MNTFSLLPGEKTTITVKTFKEITSSKTSSQNIIDSFSESSGQEMENLLQEEIICKQPSIRATNKAVRATKFANRGERVGIRRFFWHQFQRECQP
ncbi:MAG: hypothetical protein IPL33_20420 [Sphingobacteriales bacterium]|nr:hypothetical protein [Sphingobacteriales bacterium]